MKDRQAKLTVQTDIFKDSRYIVNGRKLVPGFELPHAIVIAHANAVWTNRDNVKSLNKRVSTQSKQVKVLLEVADKVIPSFEREHGVLNNLLTGRYNLFEFKIDHRK